MASSQKEINDRGDTGFAVYAAGMDASQKEKARILQYVRPGVIYEMGCGNGTVLELLAMTFPVSDITGVDLSDTMLAMARGRGYASPVRFLQADITGLELEKESIDTILFCSVLHEVYSYKGYSKEVLLDTLKDAYRALKPGGRLVIRGGVKPLDDEVLMAFRNPVAEEKFHRFAREFGPYEIPYEIEGVMVRLALPDATEFLSKYIYDTNWAVEVREQFGIYTLSEYEEQLCSLGFEIVHAESYLIEWLRVTHYEKDVELFTRIEGRLVPQDFPDSTLLLVAEKPEAER